MTPARQLCKAQNDSVARVLKVVYYFRCSTRAMVGSKLCLKKHIEP